MTHAETAWQFQDRVATALDEVGVLQEMGEQGWELTSFGPFVLHFRRPEAPEQRRPWEYLRLVEFFGPRQRSTLERDGWRYCGSWLALHYFKRPAPPETPQAKAGYSELPNDRFHRSLGSVSG